MRFVERSAQLISTTQPKFADLASYMGNPELTMEYRNRLTLVAQNLAQGWDIEVPAFSGPCKNLCAYMRNAQALLRGQPVKVQNLINANTYLNGSIAEIESILPGKCKVKPITIVPTPDVPRLSSVEEYMRYMQQGIDTFGDKSAVFALKMEKWEECFRTRKIARKLNVKWRAADLGKYQIKPYDVPSIEDKTQAVVETLSQMYVIFNKMRVTPYPGQANEDVLRLQQFCYDVQESLAMLASGILAEDEETILVAMQKVNKSVEKTKGKPRF